jgi:fructuronate reductase
VLQLMLDEAAPTIATAPGQDLEQYGAALIRRFENPALDHRLAQIAMDGSQKIPQRWLAVLAERKAAGLASPAIMTGLAAWLAHVRGTQRTVDDPLAPALAAAWAHGATPQLIAAVFGAEGVVPSAWQPSEVEADELVSKLPF